MIDSDIPPYELARYRIPSKMIPGGFRDAPGDLSVIYPEDLSGIAIAGVPEISFGIPSEIPSEVA